MNDSHQPHPGPQHSEAAQANPLLAPPTEPQSDAVPARDVTYDTDGNIAEDLPCRECGYNVRGLSPEALCPECSLPIERSVKQDLLQFAQPQWVGRLKRGLLFIIIGILSGIGAAIVGSAVLFVVIAISAARSQGGGTTNPLASPLMPFAMAAVALLGIAVSTLTVYGVWLAMSPDPSRIEAEAGRLTARRLARYCVLANILALPLQMLNSVGGMGMGLPGGGFGGGTGGAVGPLFPYLMGFGLLTQIVVHVGYVAGIVYLGQLASRIPRPGLRKQTRIVAWGYGISQGLGLLAGVGMLLIMSAFMAPGGAGGGPPTFLTGFFIFAGLAGCIGLGATVFGIWTIVLLFLFHSAFKKELAKAQVGWVEPVA